MVKEVFRYIYFYIFFCLVKCRFTYSLESNVTTESLNVPNYDEYTFNYNPVNFALANVKTDEVSFHLYSKMYFHGIYLMENGEDLHINKNAPTKFLIHGWFENETVEWFRLMKNEYLKKDYYNVVLVDWRKPASKEFSVSAANTKPVGFLVANIILGFRMNLKRIHLIGHSFGAHIAGFAGKKIYRETGSKIRRITATDPAREEFEHDLVGLDSRLSEYDADFVDVVHTDSGHYGFLMSIGTVDFYFNGGRNQNGCPPLMIDDNCSHMRSNYYFAESIPTRNFVAIKCKFSRNIHELDIFPFDKIIFGEHVSDFASGAYCLATNDKPPFALG